MMSDTHIPLPERLRPRDLSEIIGQDHLLGEHAPLRQMIDQGHLPSIIFWGPPGVRLQLLCYWHRQLIVLLLVYLH
jgi:putative ATPase